MPLCEEPGGPSQALCVGAEGALKVFQVLVLHRQVVVRDAEHSDLLVPLVASLRTVRQRRELAAEHQGRENLVDPDQRALGMVQRIGMTLKLGERGAEVQVRLRGVRIPRVLLNGQGAFQEVHGCTKLACPPVVTSEIVPRDGTVQVALLSDLFGTLQQVASTLEVLLLEHRRRSEVARLTESPAGTCHFRGGLDVQAPPNVEAALQLRQKLVLVARLAGNLRLAVARLHL
mmetsp:Transcript_95905/g.286276  ORF Transcript_95905/g.286276 Transcript_95905/m.286276 type:complete len:231 (+) Transcript_95905:211-903(+)